MKHRCALHLFALLSLTSHATAAAVKEKREDDERTSKETIAEGSTRRSTIPWVPDEYPDPDLDPRTCRTLLHRFCDPDFVLEESEIRVVEDYLKRPRKIEPLCLEQSDEEESGNPVDAQLAVALVKKIDFTRFHHDASTNGEIKAATEDFARHLHDTWGVGLESPCGSTGALLFLSDRDRSIYLSIGKALQSTLTQNRITRIISKMRPLLQEEKYGEAIVGALQEIDAYIGQGPPSSSEQASDLASQYMGIAVVGGFFGLAFFFARLNERRRRQYTQVTSQLNALDQQRALALQGQYDCKSCPICLEDFNLSATPKQGSDGRPLKLLRCGHVFDETCFLDWVGSGQGHFEKCPICREDIVAPREGSLTRRRVTPPATNDDRLVDSSVPEHNSSPSARSRVNESSSRTMRLHHLERNFRLQRLGNRYPTFVRPHHIQRWTSSNYNGPLAREPSFVRMDPGRLAANQHNLTSQLRSSGSGFGGGRSSGGGGGRW